MELCDGGPNEAIRNRTTLPGVFPGSERLRAPMGPISGRVGSLGDGVPEEIAGDKKNHPGRYNGQILKKEKCSFATLGTPNRSVAASVWSANLEPSTEWQSHKRPEVDI